MASQTRIIEEIKNVVGHYADTIILPYDTLTATSQLYTI